jgi:hypothetical protein
MTNDDTMRSTLEIISAVKDNEPVTDEELRLCIVVMHCVNHFVGSDLQKLIDAIRADRPPAVLKATAEFASGTIERTFAAVKVSPTEWLSSEDVERMAWANAVFKKATGI